MSWFDVVCVVCVCGTGMWCDSLWLDKRAIEFQQRSVNECQRCPWTMAAGVDIIDDWMGNGAVFRSGGVQCLQLPQ